MPVPLEEFTPLYGQNERNCMLDKQGSHSTRDSVATAQTQFTDLTDPI